MTHSMKTVGLSLLTALFWSAIAAEAPAQTKARLTSGYSTTTYGRSDYFPPKPAGGSITYNKGWSKSNTWEASAGVSAFFLSGQVGFNVDYLHSGSFSETFNMDPRKGLTITQTFGWYVSTYDIYQGTRKTGKATVWKLVFAKPIAK